MKSVPKHICAKLHQQAVDGRISCADALAVAADFGVSPRLVGKIADQEQLKIGSCQLGCFR